MGKKRQFKRGDDKKGNGSGAGSGFLPASQQPPPGIVIPGETVYEDRRPASGYQAPAPPSELSEEELELERVNREWLARKAARKAEQDAADAKLNLPVVHKKVDMADPFPATRELSEEELAEASRAAALDGGGANPGAATDTNDAATDINDADHGTDLIKGVDDAHEATTSEDSESSSKASAPPPVRQRKSIMELIEEANNDVELEAARRQLVASAWRARDNVYKQLFGKPAYVTPSSYREPSSEVPANFGKKDAVTDVDVATPGDTISEEQHLAVLAYGPDPQAPYWKYVTAGLATPWGQTEPLQVSGFGFELMIKTPTDSPWAAQFLRTLAFYTFNYSTTISQGVRLRLNSPIDPASESELRNAFIWYPDEAPDSLYELPSGLFSIMLVAGMTDEELRFADSVEDYGTWCIHALLKQAGYDQVTDPRRDCSSKSDNYNEMKNSVRNFAEMFRANREGKFTADDTSFS